MFPSIELFRIGFISVTIVDVVDIAIVAMIVYWLYGIIRGTIAARILIGLVAIAVVSVVSRSLDMKLLNWLLHTVGDVWVVALIVLFQPELRRILLNIGRRGMFTSFQQYDVRNVVDEILDAVEELSLRGYGALIVFKYGSDISLIVDTGVPIEAKVSKELLLSIFNPKSPLHDGAVIINGELVQSARVILPLSERMPNIAVGTRHRAALGISEQSDVFVIVLSEERGKISYAYDGILHFNQDADSIRIALVSLFNAVRDKKKRRRTFATLLRPLQQRRAVRARKNRTEE